MILHADARNIPLLDESVQCCVTSPPYWGLRDYGTPGQLGLESTPEEYVANMVAVFREVRRVMKKDGVLWLNLGDCYATGAGKVGDCPGGGKQGERWAGSVTQPNRLPIPGLKPKDLVGIPWRVAFALQADGWWLRSEITWIKPNPMPESILDRPTSCTEKIFLLAKSRRYYYNADAIREPHTYGNGGDHHRNVDLSGTWQPPGVKSPHNGLHKAQTGPGDHRGKAGRHKTSGPGPHAGGRRQAPEPGEECAFHPLGRNKRNAWAIATQPFPGSHFATFPEEIPRLCILAGSRPGDVVLDPFGGSGTTGKVALELGRRPVHIDLTYHNLARMRMRTTPAMAALMD